MTKEERRAELKAEIQLGLDQVARGEVIEVTEQGERIIKVWKIKGLSNAVNNAYLVLG